MAGCDIKVIDLRRTLEATGTISLNVLSASSVLPNGSSLNSEKCLLLMESNWDPAGKKSSFQTFIFNRIRKCLVSGSMEMILRTTQYLAWWHFYPANFHSLWSGLILYLNHSSVFILIHHQIYGYWKCSCISTTSTIFF